MKFFLTPNMARLTVALGLLLNVTQVTADEGGLSAGDTAWMLTATVLVLFMAIPGLALFYAGMVRAKNVLSVLMQCFAITALMTISLGAVRLFNRLWRRRRILGWIKQAVSAWSHRRCSQRVDPGDRLHDLSIDLCHHYPGIDRRCIR